MVLLIWEEVPEATKFFTFEEGSELALLAERAHGQMVNSAEPYDDAVKLNEFLYGLPKIELSDLPSAGPFSTVYYAGWLL